MKIVGAFLSTDWNVHVVVYGSYLCNWVRHNQYFTAH